MTKSFRLALLVAASGAGLGAAPAAAQMVNHVYGQTREDAGTALTRHLRTLSDSPRSLTALMGAGEAALELGDPQAAATFYARAEEIAPRDGRIKAGLASALVQMEQAQAALKFFSEATSLGVADAEIAADRGLAYDLSGNPARAQLDYALVLRKGDDPEVKRRMALSLAISGDRAGALKLIDGQLRQQDRAAWRTRAFVLALTGDTAEAVKAVDAVMPAQAGAMRPFLARLPSLAPAERAMAVHFGHFPDDGRVQMAANADETSHAGLPPAITDAGRPSSGQPSLARRTVPAEPVSTAPRRRPDAVPSQDVNTRIRSTQRQTAERSPATPQRTAAAPPKPAASPPRALSPQANPSSGARAEIAGPPSGDRIARTELPAAVARPVVTAAAPAAVDLPPSAVAADRTPAADVASAAADGSRDEPLASGSFADVAAAIAALPSGGAAAETEAAADAKETVLAKAEPKPAPAKETARAIGKKPEPATKDAVRKGSGKKASAEKKAEPKDPSRHWVQIAGGADKAAMSREYKRLKGKAPKLFTGQSGWTTPLNATNRLLVGPFKTEKEAQAFVNELAKADLSAFSWTSPAGQGIEKLPAR